MSVPHLKTPRHVIAFERLLEIVRQYGNHAADVDPLRQVADITDPHRLPPLLQPQTYGIEEGFWNPEAQGAADYHHTFISEAAPWAGRMMPAQWWQWLCRRYFGKVTLAVPAGMDPHERTQLLRRFEQMSGDKDCGKEDTATLETETAAVYIAWEMERIRGFEEKLARANPGAKRFSCEGIEGALAAVMSLIADFARQGGRACFLGMTHRGRLAVFHRMAGMSIDAIQEMFAAETWDGIELGDVKYHLGAKARHGACAVELLANASHLESVTPITTGAVRGLSHTFSKEQILGVICHGDGAFTAQGVTAETFNLSRLNGYDTGGTIHFIFDNQVSFTTDPKDSRSVAQPSDYVKGYGIPVVTVDSGDARALAAAVTLALWYRQTFLKDIVIDCKGYRRFGHNEGDDPCMTQPLLYKAVAKREEMLKAGRQKTAALEHDNGFSPITGDNIRPPATSADTAIPVTTQMLSDLHQRLAALPDGFHAHPAIARAFSQDTVDWAHAERLAFAVLLRHGVPVRLSGQDSIRGTFAHRHLHRHDQTNGKIHDIFADSSGFEAINSPLSEYAAMAFEYGLSLSRPEALTLWEAQFGDFANGAQIVIDQYLSSGYEKWGQQSGLVLLLPHGQEGQGPDHASARLERFLQLSALDGAGRPNWTVAQPTTPAQYFGLLLEHARKSCLVGTEESRRPLIVLTPKSLLRHPQVRCDLHDLTGGFSPLLTTTAPQDQDAFNQDTVTRVILCSGKVYYDLIADPAICRASLIVRLERLFPLPVEELMSLCSRHPQAAWHWCQEEPANQGAWQWLLSQAHMLQNFPQLYYNGPAESASTAPGTSRGRQRIREAFLAGLRR